MKELEETREEILILKLGSVNSERNITENLSESKTALNEIHQLKENIESIKNTLLETQKIVIQKAESYFEEKKDIAESCLNRCDTALRASTSQGLAGAFDDKATKLNTSIIWWVLGLIVALGLGSWVGYIRLQSLEMYLSNPDLSGIKLIVQFMLSIFSVGAPLWFAWLATKQIGQRFRLAEDYGFKASVSKAYEGYRREALALEFD